MKIILILALVVLAVTACDENNDISLNGENHITENVRKMPEVTEKEVSLGEAETKILDTGINRVSNITLACESINGTEIHSGEEFSFNKIVGKRSSERGYKDAPIIFHGEKSYGTGGGVCQVSSTVYMAALDAGMDITERHKHSESVAYAPGTDATVVYGEKDFKFKNNTDDTVHIYVWVQEEKVCAKIVKIEYNLISNN